MLIQCPQCQARYRIDTSGAKTPSTRIRCPKCAHVFPIKIDPRTDASVSTEATVSPLQQKAGVESVNVLIVDDSKFFRELIIDILRPMNLLCRQVANADEALSFLRKHQVGLILVDLNLPGKSGYELISLIRAEPALQAIRILAMSGVFRRETASIEAGQAGADDFINKSFKPEQLQHRVERLLQG